MKLRYKTASGESVEYVLAADPVTVGRSSEDTIVLEDERSSRVHFEIRPWDDEYILKDLKSRNGTYVNETLCGVVVLKVGDQIRIGSTTFTFEERLTKGTNTLIREVGSEMSDGKGYNTMLREIVDSTDEDK